MPHRICIHRVHDKGQKSMWQSRVRLQEPGYMPFIYTSTAVSDTIYMYMYHIINMYHIIMCTFLCEICELSIGCLKLH